MSSDLDAHYAVARRVAFQVEEQLQELETGRDTSAALQGNISTNLNQLAREITLLEGLLAEETSMARSGVWRRKVRQLAETSAGLREALEKFATRNFKCALAALAAAARESRPPPLFTPTRSPHWQWRPLVPNSCV